LNWRENAGVRHDVVTIPVIWLTILLSLLVHVAALWLAWPHLRQIALDKGTPGPTSTLAVELAANDTRAPSSPATVATPPPAPSAAPPPLPRRAPQVPVRPRTPARPPAAPPVMTAPAPNAPQRVPERPVEPAPPGPTAPPPPQPAQPQPPQQRPAESDLASYIESRRRERGESSASAAAPGSQGESEAERRNRIIAANLGLDRKPTFNYDPNSAGGLFQIKNVGYDDATFYFLGLDRDINRQAKVLVEVRKGDAPDIRVAIVRRMIKIIRENVQDEFLWTSQRLGRQIQMSARPQDDAKLEDFILRDIFPEYRH
jgi:hypothetical protein